MGDGEARIVQCEVIVEEKINVDRAVLVDTEMALFFSPSCSLNGLGLVKYLIRGKVGRNLHCDIKEGMAALEAPRLCFKERRDAIHVSDGHVDSVNCFF